VAIARELFKPSADAASFLGSRKKYFLIWVGGSPGRGSQIEGVSVSLTNFDEPWTPIQEAKSLAQTFVRNEIISRVSRVLA